MNAWLFFISSKVFFSTSDWESKWTKKTPRYQFRRPTVFPGKYSGFVISDLVAWIRWERYTIRTGANFEETSNFLFTIQFQFIFCRFFDLWFRNKINFHWCNGKWAQPVLWLCYLAPVHVLYLNFILTLPKFYPDKIRIKSE